MMKVEDGFAEVLLVCIDWSGGGVDALIVDEAAQATEAEIIVALQLQPSRCLLVGDPCTLPRNRFCRE